jgi:hypothetical protein
MIHGERRTILHSVEAEVGILYSTCKIILVQGIENEGPVSLPTVFEKCGTQST